MSENPFLDMAGIPATAPAAGVQPPQVAANVAPIDGTRAVRNNNPGNLRWDGKSQWQGMTGVDPQGFVQFDSPENGQRALSINLGNQGALHGLNTVRDIIAKYAPPHDGNDTGAYVAHVAQSLGVGPDDQIDPSDPRINQALQSVIVPVEGGGGMPAAGGAPAAPQAPARNPFLEMANGSNAGADGSDSARRPDGAGGGSYGLPTDGGGSDSGGPDPRLAQSDGRQLADWASGIGHWAAGLEPLSNKLVNGVPIGTSLRDNAAGLVSGAASVPETLMHAAAWVTDKAAPGNKTSAALRDWAGKMERGANSLAADPNSTMFKSRELAGMIGATAPVAELDVLSAAARSARAGKLATSLARYGDMALQGGAAGGLTSRGENVGQNMAAGAVLAPVLGAAVDKALPVLLKAGEKASGSKLAQALRDRLAGGAGEAGADAAGTFDAALAAKGWKPDEIAQGWRRGADGASEFVPSPTIRKGSDAAPDALNANGGTTADGRPIVNIYGGVPEAPATPPIQGEKPPIDPATLSAAVRSAARKGGDITPSSYVDDYLAGKGRSDSPEDMALQQYAANNAKAIEAEFQRRADGAATPGAAEAEAPTAAPEAPAANDTERLRAAMGSRGARRGLESDINWPPEVQQHAQRLVADGLPLDQALREAEITYAGGSPTLAHVTRNPADQRAMWEGAKQDTVEGQQLASQISTNNNALHTTLQGDIGKLGGAPAEGEATESAARSLATSADRGREEVSRLYRAAEEASGQVRVPPEEVYAVVSNPRHQAAVTNEGAAFIRGLRARLDQLTLKGKRGLTGPELDQLHQHASFAFDPSASKEVNKLIWEAKDAINFHLDQIGEAGPAYAKARAAHRAWAEQYENPEGVRKLIARNVGGEFKHDGNWRKADGLITTLADRPFAQVVKQLRANNDTATLDRIKASVIQSAYEYATGARGGNAVDMLGNSPVSGKMFLAKLDAIGMPKLKALFSPAELGRLATIGRAASHLNEAVPGTVNTSGTSSALLNALRNVQGVKEARTGVKSRALDAALLVGGQVAGHALMPGVGGVVAGTAGNFAKGAAESIAEKAARKEVAEQLRQMMNPTASRSADRAAAARLADQLRRRATARTISDRTPPIVGSAQQKKRQK